MAVHRFRVARRARDANFLEELSEFLRWLPAAGHAPPALFERAAFRLRMRGDLPADPAYLPRLSLSPTEEARQAGGAFSRSRLLDTLRRPFRLALKYGCWAKS
jgi:hypothetical protein